MVSSNTQKKYNTDIEKLQQQIEIIAVANNKAICERFPKLKSHELDQLTNDVAEYVSDVKYKLEEIEASEEHILEKIEKVEDLRTEITRKKNSEKWFHRDIGPIEKTIMISNYYSAPLIEKLCLLCDVYTVGFKDEYNKKNNQQKFEEIKQHVVDIPVSFAQKTTSRYRNTKKYIDALSNESKNTEFKEKLDNLRQIINKISNVRKVTFWISAIPALCIFVWLSIIWGEKYGQNIFVPIASIAIAGTAYVIVFNAIICIYKKIVL